MLTLGILSKICCWWPLWYLLSGLLGLLLGWLIWSKWKKMYNELQGTVSGYKKTIADLEAALAECKRMRADAEGKIALAEGRAKEAERRAEAAGGATVAASSIAATPKPEPKAPAAPTAGKYAKLKEDNLQIIEGIGPKMNQVLIDGGVTSWSVLAGKSHADLKAVLDKYGDKYRIIDPAEWPAQAAYAAKGDWDGLIAYQKNDGSDSKAEKLMIKMGIIKAFKENDLKAIEGIGPKIESIMNAAGINTWREMSNTSTDKLQSILAAAGDRYKLADPTSWPKQAEYAADGDWDGLEKYQDFLDGGRTPS